MDFIVKRHGDIEYQLSLNLRSKALGRDEQNGFGDGTPIVALLLGGNFTTLRALCRYLKQGTPVVVVE
ncbi:unnamed protein product, partial [Rotaria sp. Silwood1]